MANCYKITALLIKPGNLPAQWTRYSDKKMTLTDCEKFFSTSREFGRTFGDKVMLKDFRCEKIEK